MIEEANYNISEIVKAAGITRQAYYKWRKRKLSKKEQQDQEILEVIKQIEDEHRQSVGYDKMTRLINKSRRIAYRVNKKRIVRVMREHGIKADYRQPRRKRVQERQKYQAQNLLNRQFKQQSANQVWVTDTTELTYGINNKVRLHVVLDLYDQYPVSWLITPTETTQGAIQAFEQARQKEHSLAPLIHTDRGSAYMSKAFNEYLSTNHSQHSYSAPGTPADNAVIEHWWADFKTIWIAHAPKINSLEELQEQVRQGINYFKNKFISSKRNDLTATEFRFGKAN